MSNGENAFQKVASCIPQVYFDIIGRVIPGALIMGSIWIAVCGPKEFFKFLYGWLDKSTISSATVATVLVILTSYTLAILLWCVWSYLITTLFKLFFKFYSEPKAKEYKEREKKKFWEKIYWDNEGFRKQYERLKYYNIAAGNRVTKLKAQIHMAETLFVGLLLSCWVGITTYLIEVVTYFLSCSEPKTVIPSLIPRLVSWVLLLVTAVCSLFARQYFIDHMNNSLDNNIKILEGENEWKYWY
ncbi:MAG: hypothetical protein GY845_11485 [Planctomycetes bacterium]|nr:hypothetical protein [Planctomycetota bacterium]